MHILIADDGASQRRLLAGFLADEGHEVAEAADGPAALAHLESAYVDLLLLDFKMPGMDGLAVLEAARKRNPELDVIMMTAYGTIDTAVAAMKAGAADYLSKPVDLDELTIQIGRIAERRLLVRENARMKEALAESAVTADHIIFESAAMADLVNLAGRVADSDATVLIQGESGTGKELLAGLVHALSPRSGSPMVTVNCAALAESLLESELFGHERGAFTGADRRRIGRFEEADGGSLFLDEIGELSPAVQVKLLRFLQEREFQRVGGNRPLRADVRVISATNRDLKAEVAASRFREDLFYRLNVVGLEVPPLRERRADIGPLVDHFLDRFAGMGGRERRALDARARDLLLKYDYPGNVRELENIVERAVVLSRGPVITARELPFGDGEAAAGESGSAEADGCAESEDAPIPPLKEALDSLERELIQRALARTEGHQVRAAEMLGISERMLRYKLKKMGGK
jgi:two-component system NtrC family response regulator